VAEGHEHPLVKLNTIEFSLKSCPVGPQFHLLFGASSPFDLQSLAIKDQTLETQHDHLSNNFCFFTSRVGPL
jgi:hypothetical protein